MHCALVPAFDQGRTIGFKVFSVRPGSTAARLCLKNGDVITHLNGTSVSNPENGLRAYNRLRDSTRVDVDLLRAGTAVRLSYVIAH